LQKVDDKLVTDYDGEPLGELPLIAYLAVALPMGEECLSLKPLSAEIIKEFASEHPFLAEGLEVDGSMEAYLNLPERRAFAEANLTENTNGDQSPTEAYDDYVSEVISDIEETNFNDETFLANYWALLTILDNVRKTGKIEGNATFPTQEIAVGRKRRLDEFLANDAEKVFDGLIFFASRRIGGLKEEIETGIPDTLNNINVNDPNTKEIVAWQRVEEQIAGHEADYSVEMQVDLKYKIFEDPDFIPTESELEAARQSIHSHSDYCKKILIKCEERLAIYQSLKSQFQGLVQIYKEGLQR